MLVLARKEGEAVTITTPEGFAARIVLLRSAEPVRVGIEAPQDWLILREELTDKGGSKNGISEMENR